MAETSEYLGLSWFENRSAYRSYYYLPRYADVQRDAQGRPLVSLVSTGAGGFLMFTGVWQAAEDALEGLRKEIAERDGIADPESIRLSFAPVRSVTGVLSIGDGSGALTGAVATSTTSGAPPYSALFNVVLTAEQVVMVVAALHGRPGFLLVDYRAGLFVPVPTGARLKGAGPEFVAWLRGCAPSGPPGLRAALEEAVTEGLASVVLSLPENPPAGLVLDLYDRVLTQATEMAPAFLDAGVVHGAFVVDVAVVHDVEEQISVRADLSALAGRDTIVLPAVESVPEGARPQRVRLGFDPAGAPLAWVRVRRGDLTRVLEMPDFGPVEISAGDAPLGITAGFTDGAATYRTEVPADGSTEVVLGPGDVGLTAVTVDGRPLAEAGARSAEVWLTCRPARGPVVRRTIRFGGGDWVARWWTAAPPPRMDYSWVATIADGRTLRTGTTYAETESIVVSFSGGAGDVADRQSSDH